MTDPLPTTTPDIAPQLSAVHNDEGTVLVQSWYPLLRSSDLSKGKSIAVDVLGHSILVFRTKANELGAVQRQCCHMGGDLARGRVAERGISCPIHGWQFGIDGARINQGPRPIVHADACQPALQCAERHGIIFAFFGPEILFELPKPEEAVYRSKVAVRDFDARYDIPTVFGFDSEHFATVHHRGIESMELYTNAAHHLGTRFRSAVVGENLSDRLMRAVGLKTVDVDVDYWGANIMLGHHKRSDTYALLTTLPLGAHRMRMFITLMQKRSAGGLVRQSFGWLRFYLTQPVIRAFIRQDEQALRGARFDPQRSLLSNNPGVQRWLAHYRALPKIAAQQIFPC